MTPCSTLEQRWSACRARVRGEERVRDFAWCNLWKPHLTREEALQWFTPLMRRGWHARPCTSPRRHQCRAGTSYHDPQLPTMPRTWRDVIDPAVWPRMVSRLRQMKTITESVDFEEPDPFV